MSLVCTSSAELLDAFAGGKAGSHPDDRREDRPRRRDPRDRPARLGRAHAVARRRSSVRLPVSIGCSDCAFRAPIREVLQEAGIEWRSVSEITNADAQVATTAADIAVMAFMAATVPSSLEILGPESGLPKLPPFTVNLYLPKDGGSEIARELARYIRDAIIERHRMAA